MTTKYAQLPLNLHQTLATTAGVILSDFDPENPGTAEEIQARVMYATTGGVTLSCVAFFQDHGKDIDNCPKNIRENMEISAWECKLIGTALTLTEDTALSLMGAADKTQGAAEDDALVFQARTSVYASDFKTLWYVCPYGTQGGFLAVKLENALNRGGFSWKTREDGKGRFAFEYVGHSDLSRPYAVPFTFYMKKSDSSAAQTVAVEV